MKNRNLGFTLIELLIVIAIIGIVTSIVLSSLNSSRDKGYESQIKQQLVQFRSAAEVYFYAQNPPTYGVSTDCTGPLFSSLNVDDGKPGQTIDPGVLPSGVNRVCGSADRAYAIKITSYMDNNAYWCADSKGVLKLYTGSIGSSQIQCP